MLRWATIFFVVPLLAIVAAWTGFAASAATVALIMFVVAVAAFIATFFLEPPDDVEENYDTEWSRQH
ncbi:DUF1328 domain-containing protein [Pigmentiphaga sp.]|jgi:Small integral membrane protein|uniref:DUF1328 domain-containing protein n=1 Tax=Pigmentiphaga sp. TaxID=1977564 RepID=UPI0025DC3C12|nr:DUF1328 domain-containing protein [Pigmentiphaga sp.]